MPYMVRYTFSALSWFFLSYKIWFIAFSRFVRESENAFNMLLFIEFNNIFYENRRLRN